MTLSDFGSVWCRPVPLPFCDAEGLKTLLIRRFPPQLICFLGWFNEQKVERTCERGGGPGEEKLPGWAPQLGPTVRVLIPKFDTLDISHL